MSLPEISIGIAALGLIVTLVTLLVKVLVKMNSLSFTVGQMKQSVTDKLDTLEKEGATSHRRMERLTEQLERHMTEQGTHLNPVLEERSYSEQRDWRKGVNEKLDLLIRERGK